MSKYTRLNKINHYHDSGSSSTLTANTSAEPPLVEILSPRNCIRQNSNRMYSLASLAIVSVLLLSIVGSYQVEALNCYHCSSIDNPDCDETFNSTLGHTKPIETDCSKVLYDIGKSSVVCRKIVQYIEHKKVVIRSCGYIDNDTAKDLMPRKPMCNKRSGTFAIMMESCNCYEDLCNHSASLVPQSSVISSLLAGSSLLLILFCLNNYNCFYTAPSGAH